MRVAIVGGGATGSTLATLLAEDGADVTLFHDARVPPLVVGESLVPAIIPILRRLGVEDEVKQLGLYKPGVTFAWSPADHFQFSFLNFPRLLGTPYAYNVPRPQFDALLLTRAVRAGVRRVDSHAELVRGAQRDTLQWDDETLAAAPELRSAPPDLIVDATGRRRLVARLLGLPTRVGPRNDVAHFAHFSGFNWDEPVGQVLISRLREGWSWRIPLPEKLSVGIVLDRTAAARLGTTPAERLERAIAEDPALASAARRANRLTDVVTYSNYQLITYRSFGPGWVLAGDALGFVDPMLSPGVFLAMHSAELLARALRPAVRRCAETGAPGDFATPLEAYTQRMERILSAWMSLVQAVYDGTLLGLFRAGSRIRERHDNTLSRAIERHIGTHFAAMASGTQTTSLYSRGLLRFLGRYCLSADDRIAFAVR